MPREFAYGTVDEDEGRFGHGSPESSQWDWFWLPDLKVKCSSNILSVFER
jgi:hypothetical protein